MSDYLEHLVARTLSPETGVRPALRSVFEPPSLHGQFTLSTDFEQDALIESASSLSLRAQEEAQFQLAPSPNAPNAAPKVSATSGQPPRPVAPPPSSASGAEHPALELKKEIAPLQPFRPPNQVPRAKPAVLQHVTSAPPDSTPAKGEPISTPPSSSLVAQDSHATATFNIVPRGAAVVSHQNAESKLLHSEEIAVPAIRSIASQATRPTPDSPVSVSPRPQAETLQNLPANLKDQRSERSAVAAIRHVEPAALVFAPSLAPAAALPQQTIHVTIGRVEVRAATVPAPAQSRTRTALPPVMSLEDYLARRASGGQR